MAGGNDIGFRIGGDASQLLSEQGKAERGQNRITDSMQRSARVSSSTANRIIRDIETQGERYNRLQKQSRDAYKQGQLSADQYGRRVRQLQNDYQAQEGPFRKFASDAKIDFEELSDKADGFGDVIGTWGPRLSGALGLMQVLRQGFQESEAAIQKGVAAVEGRVNSSGSLRQLADNQSEFDELTSTARRFRLSGAVDSLSEGEQVTFALKSADFLDNDSLDLFLKLGKRRVVPDLAKFARAIRTQVGSFGRAETGSAAQIASKSFAASEFAPSSVEELLEASVQAAGTASALGISDEENLAATAVLAGITGKPTVGATDLRSFLGATAQLDGFEGLGIAGRVRKLQGQNLAVEQLLQSPSKGGLGSVEAFRAFSDLEKNLSGLQQATRKVEAANFDSAAIDRKVALRDPLAEAARLARVTDARAELNTLALSARRIVTDSLEEETKARAAANAHPLVSAAYSGFASAVSAGTRLVAGQRGEESLLLPQGESEAGAVIQELRQLRESVERVFGEQVSEQRKTNVNLEQQEGGLPITNE